MLDDRDMACELVRQAAQRMDHDLAEIQAALDEHSADKVRRLAHRLKGTAGNLSAGPLLRACRAMEQAGELEDWESLPGLWGDLRGCVAIFQQTAERIEEIAEGSG